MTRPLELHPDRLFPADPDTRAIARTRPGQFVGRHPRLCGTDGQFAAPVHRVACVDRQVQDGVFHLGAVAEDRPVAGPVLDRHLHPVAQRPVEQVAHPRHQLAGMQRFRGQRLLAAEHQQPAGQRGGAVRTLGRAVEMAMGVLGRARPLRQFESAQYDRQHIVEIMRDATGQLAERVHLLDLAQLGLLHLQFLGRGLDRAGQLLRPGAFGMRLGAGFGAFALGADDHPSKKNAADRQCDAEERQPARQPVGALDRGAGIRATLFEQGALAADQCVQRPVDLEERVGLTRRVIQRISLTVAVIGGRQRDARQFVATRIIGSAQPVDKGLLTRIFDELVQPVELRAGQCPFLRIELAQLAVAGDDVATQ